ncbi:MAG: hypothetical protein ACRC41_11645 [Sarcina sp.]
MLKLDYETSVNLSGFNKFENEENSSYNTLYNFIINNKSNFSKNRYKIAYGYVINKTYISFRHCFLIESLTKTVIDPSVKNYIVCDKEINKYKYEVFTEFKNLEEYFFAIKFSKYIAKEEEKTLERLLRDEENTLLEKLQAKKVKDCKNIIIAS